MTATIRADVRAIFDRDPAARSTLEVLFCYPGLHAIWFYRLGHWFWTHHLFFLGRLTSHLGRWLTGLADRGCIQDETVAADHEAAVGALVEHIVGTFWRLDQFGGRPGR